ncbi:protein MANBAL [Podarcis lilfordi]|uniref:Protein MANBAL n=2 Tax=Podarcis lilfordi TaxID=74358 RepID=A0AA35KJR3_9SAUR|nr:protein MANBAL [Podarcis lilfordi]
MVYGDENWETMVEEAKNNNPAMHLVAPGRDISPDIQAERKLLKVDLWTCAMAAELDFSPPEIPEPTFMENILHYGLFFGAIFQLICVLAIILPIPKTHKMDTENYEIKTSDVVKKPKAATASLSKKPKKETKKKR